MNNIIDMPTLYKKTNTGAIQYWRIGYKQSVIDGSTVGSVHTEYGQLNTDKPQVTVDVIREGKNLGRSNETTPYSQAMAEAKQKWDKQIKKGYSEDMDKAEAGDKGLPGIDPMLAHTWEKHGAKFHFPGFVQPKLDGLRAICVIENSKARFYSRTRKEFLTVPHLQRQIQNLCHLNGIIGGVVFDGELYSHELKHDFNKIISIVKRDEVHEDVEKIEYHIYDLPSQHGAGFDGRWTTLKSFFGCMPKSAVLNLKLVRTEPVADKEKLKEFFEKCLKNGYEGAKPDR